METKTHLNVYWWQRNKQMCHSIPLAELGDLSYENCESQGYNEQINQLAFRVGNYKAEPIIQLPKSVDYNQKAQHKIAALKLELLKRSHDYTDAQRDLLMKEIIFHAVHAKDLQLVNSMCQQFMAPLKLNEITEVPYEITSFLAGLEMARPARRLVHQQDESARREERAAAAPTFFAQKPADKQPDVVTGCVIV
jgi:hypothetical protein